MRGTFLKNRDIFTKLCGDDAMRNVILVTTKWAEVVPEAGERCEEELKADVWKDMLSKGAATARFMHTCESAWEIVNLLVPKERLHALLIQQQLVDLGRSLPETAAGMTLQKQLQDQPPMNTRSNRTTPRFPSEGSFTESRFSNEGSLTGSRNSDVFILYAQLHIGDHKP
jgi:hypothetical protein